ncbi:MAG TPA: TonB-dependent receptor [Caulobacteraceae bacterium]|nr:TonB-dependent receptor [Caulobacteraceae bacterium]
MGWNGRAAALAAAAGATVFLASLSHAHAADAAPPGAPANAGVDSDKSEIKAAAAPTIVLTRRQWDDSGKFSLGDFLQTLPQQGNAPNLLVNNGGDGATRISLRSLGVSRTLVLVDGRRTVNSGLGASDSVDLNTLPDAAVDHVEVLTDGASALWGSGAVAGVVNIVTRHGFEGFEARADYGISARGDGQAAEVDVLDGHSTEKASYLLALSFDDQRPVWAGDRSWSAQSLIYDYGSGMVAPGASSATPQGSVNLFAAAQCLALCSALLGSGSDVFIHDPSAPLGWRPFTNADRYNFAPLNYLSTPTRRAQIFLDGDLDLGDVRAYYQAWYTWRRSEQQLAPQPLLTGQDGFVVSAFNLYNPFGADVYDVRRRLVEFGPRTFREDAGTYRVLAGLDGVLRSAGPFTGWNWDLAVDYGRSSGTLYTNGLYSNSRVAAALGPSLLLGGAPRCVSNPGDSGSVIPGCVPLNLFDGPGSIDAAQVAWARFQGRTGLDDSLLSVTGRLSGGLVGLPSGRKARLSLGWEFRRERGSEVVDPGIAAGDAADGYYVSTRGSQRSEELRAELAAPILAGGPLVRLFEIDAAGDYAHYGSFGGIFSYRFGWRLEAGDARLYGSYARSFRAPDLRELSAGVTLNYPFAVDPCFEFSAVPPKVAAQCVATGVPAPGSLDFGYQEPTYEGGNPRVGPEKSRTLTLGLAFAPRNISGLSLNLDYYRIDIEDVIDAIGAAGILQLCYPFDGSAPDPLACAAIVRDPVSGLILHIDDTVRNDGSLKTDGFDLQVRASRETAIGHLGFLLDATWVNSFTRASLIGPTIRGVGNFDLGAVPRFKANAELTWARNGWGARLGARYVSPMKECDPDCYAPYVDPFEKTTSRRIPAWVVVDAQVGRHLVRWSMGLTDIAIGVNNLFDRAPPFVSSALQDNSDPSLYDFLGRFVYLRLTHTL